MKKLNTEILIILVLWLSIILSLYFNFKFDIFFIIGIFGISIVSATYKKYNKNSLAILFLILVFSSFDLIKFSWAFGINLGIINIISFSLLLILVYKRRNEFFALKNKWFGETFDEQENGKITRIEFFKKEFNHLSETELNKKLNEEVLTKEAKTAIIEILKLKKGQTE